jgi:hypothetical protein
LVYVQISCTDLAYYDKFNAAYKAYFTKDLPAREFVASILRGGHLSMQAIAVRHLKGWKKRGLDRGQGRKYT